MSTPPLKRYVVHPDKGALLGRWIVAGYEEIGPLGTADIVVTEGPSWLKDHRYLTEGNFIACGEVGSEVKVPSFEGEPDFVICPADRPSIQLDINQHRLLSRHLGIEEKKPEPYKPTHIPFAASVAPPAPPKREEVSLATLRQQAINILKGVPREGLAAIYEDFLSKTRDIKGLCDVSDEIEGFFKNGTIGDSGKHMNALIVLAWNGDRGAGMAFGDLGTVLSQLPGNAPGLPPPA